MIDLIDIFLPSMLCLLSSILSENYTDTVCYKCLKEKQHEVKFYCVTTGECMDDTTENKNSCPNIEQHDLIMDAEQCCSDIKTENECLSEATLSYCLYCPGPDLVANTGMCMHNGNSENINHNCHSNPDVSSQCSQYTNCSSCAADVVCSWCPSMSQCITIILDDQPYPEDKYRCLDGRTKICCDSYSDCETCSSYSGSITSLICTWCQNNDGTGHCYTFDKAKEECVEGVINLLAVNYCQDKCYMAGDECSSCLSQKGCIWIDEMYFTDQGSSPQIKQLCAAGGSGGPKASQIDFMTKMNMIYQFTVVEYNYMTCSMHASTLNITIISIVVTIVVVIIAAYLGVYIHKRRLYAKLLRESELSKISPEQLKLLEQEQEDFKAEDMEEYIQVVSWFD